MQAGTVSASGTAAEEDPRPNCERDPLTWLACLSSAWWGQLSRASRSILMLDYDGTLAPFVRERMQAKPYPGVPERLLRLAVASRTRLVLISGRPARELPLLLPPDLRVEIWGSHGRERLFPNGRYEATPLQPAQQQCLDQLEASLHERGLAHLLEKKVGSVAIHTRGLCQDDATHIVSLARGLTCSTDPGALPKPGLEWLPFDGGLELRGAGCTKATAVHSILSQEPPHAPAAYLGDDRTDEDAFTALHARGSEGPSLSVLVRPQPRPTAADLWIAPPDELLAFLDRWLATVAPTEVSSR
jgi:trehalose-phosphatase